VLTSEYEMCGLPFFRSGNEGSNLDMFLAIVELYNTWTIFTRSRPSSDSRSSQETALEPNLLPWSSRYGPQAYF